MLKYNFLLYLISPFILLKLIIYGLKNSTPSSFIRNKLLGKSLTKNYSLWLHAASVGEMKIAIKVSQYLLKKGYKDILLTSNTPSSEFIFKDSGMNGVDHCYLPFDFFFVTKKFVKSVSADLLIIIETEIWPNLYNCCKKNKTNIITINGRFNPPKGLLGLMSKKLYTSTLDKIDHIYCKSQKDVSAFKEYMDDRKISLTGNIKHSLVSNDVSERELLIRNMFFLHHPS